MKNCVNDLNIFKQLNEEINELHKYLRENKFSQAEIKKIFTPLNAGSNKIKFLKVCLTGAAIIFSIYLLSQCETFAWNVSAIGRIFLVKLLPYWDWTELKNEKCLIFKNFENNLKPEKVSFNCALCENQKQIDVYPNSQNISEEFLKIRYLDVQQPVIITNALENWPKSKNLILEKLNGSEIISDSLPCNLRTNLHYGVTSLGNIFDRSKYFSSFFLHFQNCELAAMKIFRSVFPRLTFLPFDVPPSRYNWLVWSRDYHVTKFKRVEGLVEGLVVFGQAIGGNFLRLLPRDCEGECEEIEIELKEGQVLVFTSLWDLEYRPGGGENIAAILEYRY